MNIICSFNLSQIFFTNLKAFLLYSFESTLLMNLKLSSQIKGSCILHNFLKHIKKPKLTISLNPPPLELSISKRLSFSLI